MRETEIIKTLQRGLSCLGCEALDKPLMHYLCLLEKWNQAYNLTAVRDMQSMISKHILDSLAVSPWLKGEQIIDVGTGAGLPGIPLALLHKEKQFTLLDSNGKKTRFLQEVRRQLDLKNVEIVHHRLESYHKDDGFDTLVSRAFSSVSQMIDWSAHLLKEEGIWLAMKGPSPFEELEALSYPYQVHTYEVPELEARRSCVVINKNKG